MSQVELQRAPIVIVHKDHPLDPSGVNAGAETATISLARALVRLGEKVIVAAQLPPGSISQNSKLLEIGGVYYFDLTDSFDTQAAFQFFDAYAKDGYHLIVASRAQALLESRYNPRILSRVFISHEPAAGALGAQPSVIGKVANQVIAVSAAQRQALVDAGCDPEKISIIPNGADLELFRPGIPEKRNYNQLLFVGALVMDKGVHLLIEAFSTLKGRHPELKLDLYGSAKMWGREDYFDTTEASRFPGITFHGAVPQQKLVEAYATSGLLVLPSIWFDSFPLTAVEAQVTGLPVLGSAQGGMKEIIRHDVTGRVLEHITRETLIAEIEGLIKDPKKLEAMSRAALATIRNDYGWDSIAQAFVRLAKECSSRRSASSKTSDPNNLLAQPRVGFFTTFNQRCGLATYASYLLKGFDPNQTIILAEDVSANEKIGSDGANVRRCWKRGERDLTRLMQVIREEGLQILHLNCHYRFFDLNALARFLSDCKARGVKVIAHVHNPYTVDRGLQTLIAGVDRVIVHTPENRLEVIANGARAEAVEVVEHGGL